jgi:hypothetical protein
MPQRERTEVKTAGEYIKVNEELLKTVIPVWMQITVTIMIMRYQIVAIST